MAPAEPAPPGAWRPAEDRRCRLDLAPAEPAPLEDRQDSQGVAPADRHSVTAHRLRFTLERPYVDVIREPYESGRQVEFNELPIQGAI